MVPVIWTRKPGENGNLAIGWDSQDCNVRLPQSDSGVLAAPNQATFQSTLDSLNQLTNHVVITLQHDIYVVAVKLATGYQLPHFLAHNPPFYIKPIIRCQGFPSGDMYVGPSTNRDRLWYESGDVLARMSNIRYGGMLGVVTFLVSRTHDSTEKGSVITTGASPNVPGHFGLVSGGVAVWSQPWLSLWYRGGIAERFDIGAIAGSAQLWVG